MCVCVCVCVCWDILFRFPLCPAASVFYRPGIIGSCQVYECADTSIRSCTLDVAAVMSSVVLGEMGRGRVR